MTTATRRFVPLTVDDLRALGACDEQVTEFARRFPNGATPDDADRADGLDASWLCLVLDEAAYEAVQQPALAAYQAVQQPAWAAYEAVQQPALAAYQAVQQPALAAYQARLQSESLDALRELWPVWEVAP